METRRGGRAVDRLIGNRDINFCFMFHKNTGLKSTECLKRKSVIIRPFYLTRFLLKCTCIPQHCKMKTPEQNYVNYNMYRC